MATNLPASSINDSAKATKIFYDTYGQPTQEFPATDIDASVAFFTNKGFDSDAAISTSATLLKQAKIEGVPIFSILDTLKGFSDLQLSALVGQILNNNRVPTSTLGYKSVDVTANKERNILS